MNSKTLCLQKQYVVTKTWLVKNIRRFWVNVTHYSKACFKINTTSQVRDTCHYSQEGFIPNTSTRDI